MPQIFGIDSGAIAALFATQMVFELYGAGIRRPFGSLATVQDIPATLRQAAIAVKVADVIFVLFVLGMWVILFTQINFIAFLIGAWVFAAIGEYATDRIRLVPSFFISIAFAILAVVLVWRPDVPAAW